jgi:hypothetical protein
MSEMTREERAQGYLSMTKAVSQQFVKALQQDVFPDEETEKVFGIVMNDIANDGIGDMIYRAYSEIYKRRLSHARTETHARVQTDICEEAVETSVVYQLAEDFASALASINLARTFQVLMEQVIDDTDIPYGVHCKQLQARGLNYSFVIHPTNREHREWMERLREELGEGATARDAASSYKVSGICNFCGKAGRMARCSACKEVSYCNQTHQKADWKQHKPCCKLIIANPKSIWIEVTEGEGNGLSNTMMNHIFPQKE